MKLHSQSVGYVQDVRKLSPKSQIQNRKLKINWHRGSRFNVSTLQRFNALRRHRSRLSRWWLAQAVKKPVLFFLSFVSFVVSFPAATITGTIQNTSGAAYATNALFAPLSTPLASGNNIIASTTTNVTAAANGTFSVVL